MELLKTTFWNGGQRRRSDNVVVISEVWTYVVDFLPGFSGTACWTYWDNLMNGPHLLERETEAKAIVPRVLERALVRIITLFCS